MENSTFQDAPNEFKTENNPNEDTSDAIKQSKFYKKAATQAIKVAADKNKVLSLVSKAFLYFQKNEGNRPIGEEIKEKFNTLLRLVRALYKKEYSLFPWSSLLKTIAVLIYLVSPIDALPDFIPVVGFIDDFALISWVITSLNTDILNFENWEKEQNTPQLTD
ncbi:hypothetical protein Fleli_3070 [Bernardetia litoralis DSM 6794]|uniref:DUF1232 domain-containing protein n=1 Tax=Bernardetia litoralis (strain ATCC 23117 / DSM 6794 / NBRC 15988 / NCIMB 1366 / Fx l1 / Sio-4) TaxID=880071 RepID=I4AN75_BERLS|nr:YkvA family protein [Bernardetia litoralis]AFM05410.1 hypothetical protein Fleli_3070 [Bernardetia litoralis DSM 6794]